jgi:hypothetical protein
MKPNGRERTHLLLHPDHARPLLYEEAVALLPKVRLEVGLQIMGISALWQLYRAYQFRILLELLEGFREASIMEIVEDCFVSVNNEIDWY